MEQIRNKEYGGERPLFATHDLQLEDVTIHAGESALKECSNTLIPQHYYKIFFLST